jgi:hypothetical protein
MLSGSPYSQVLDKLGKVNLGTLLQMRAPLLGFRSEYVTGMVTRLVMVRMKKGKKSPYE